jgi:hypothetical protein
LEELEKKLSEKKCNLLALRYLQKIKSLTDHWATSSASGTTQQKNNKNV